MLSAGKRIFTKSTVIFSLVPLIVIATTLDFLWASISSSSSSSSSSLAHLPIASHSDIERNHVVVIPKTANGYEPEKKGVENEVHKNDRVPEQVLSGTFADLPAPELKWEEMPTAPVPRLDGFAIQIENLLYVF